MTRIERLAALLDEPLLVAGPPYVLGGQTNVRYLTGLKSSNAAVLVEPDGRATLFTDFRYAQRAGAISGIEFVEIPRGMLLAIGERLAGRRIGIEEEHLPHAGFRVLTDAGVEAVPTTGLVESLRAVKDEAEIAAMRRAGALSDEIFAALAERAFQRVARSESSRGGSSGASARPGAEGVSFEAIVAAGTTGASPHAVPGDEPIEPGVLVDGRRGMRSRRLLLRLHAHVRGRRDLRATGGDLRALPRSPARRPRGRGARGARARCGRSLARRHRGSRLGWAYGHGMGHGVGLQIHEAPSAPPGVGRRARARGNVVSVEPGIYLPGRGRRAHRGSRRS